MTTGKPAIFYSGGQGFARSASESAYPRMWDGLFALWEPRIGPQASGLINLARKAPNTTMVRATAVEMIRPSLRGMAVYFDGNNNANMNYMTVTPDNGAMADFTFMCWGQILNPTQFPTIMACNIDVVGGTPGILFRLDSGTTITYLLKTDNGTQDFASFSYTPAAGDWAHFVYQKKGTTVNIYINGRLIGSETNASWDTLTLDSQIFLGRDNRNSPDGPFGPNGYFNDFRMYSRAVPQDEIMLTVGGASPIIPMWMDYGFVPPQPAGHPTMRRWSGSIQPTGFARVGRGW